MARHNLFISHSWAYGDAYVRLIKLLAAAPRFEHANYSVPRNDPIHNARNDAALRAAIREQMKWSHVVIVLAGVYATYSKWINEEIIMAKTGFVQPKPILAIQPWGAERTSLYVKQNADAIVNWNTNSIITALRDISR